jgi:hypothetical protein
MIQSLRSHAPIVAFALSLSAIYVVALVIVSRLGQLENPGLIAGALTLDLTLLVPLLYYLLLVRSRGWPMLTVLPVFLVSVLIAQRLIPRTQHHVLDLVSFGAVLAEVALVAVIAHKALQLRRRFRERAATGMDVYESLRESAASVLGPVAGGAVAYEAAVFYYAVAGWTKSPEPDDRSFSVHRRVAYAALMIAVMIALVVETAAVHLLVRLWSPVTAWILTGLSVYALIWMVGDIHAVRLRPVQISDEMLHLRLGLRWTISIPIGSIAAVRAPVGEVRAEKREYLKAVLIGTPNRRIESKEPVSAIGLYGISRSVTTIDLHIDEPGQFDAALDQAGDS